MVTVHPEPVEGFNQRFLNPLLFHFGSIAGMSSSKITNSHIEAALHGEILYGDDFSQEDIEAWFADEADGYSNLDHQDSQSDACLYRALDEAYAWDFLPSGMFDVMGLGSAWGSEFKAISSRIHTISIVEPGTKFWRDRVAGIPTRYVSPVASGQLPFDDESFDVVTAFGVLHHIPNVSQVLCELARVVRPGGRLFIREPITSMGDWRRPRRGLTCHERGLPQDFIALTCGRLGLQLIQQRLVGFGPLVHLASGKAGAAPWNNRYFVSLDGLLSRFSEWNWSYHRTNIFKRFSPTIGCWVLIKPCMDCQL